MTKDPYPRSNDGVTRIGDSMGDWRKAAEAAWQAQQAFLSTPEGQSAWEGQKAAEAAEGDREALSVYTSRGIPHGTAVSLWTNRAPPQPGERDGVVLVEPDFERELFKAMDDNVLLCLLLGVVGTGKTLSACRWLHEKGADSARYCRSKDVAALSPKYDGDRPALEALQSAPQLVIDEVGMEEERDWGKIEDLLHLRYEWRRPTVALANLKPKAFEQRYKERIARRVSALGKTIVARDVLCPGEKRRLMGRQEKLNV